MATRQPRAGTKGAGSRSTAPDQESSDAIAHDLSYAEARTALDLALAQLQATDLEVEAMAGLFQRAQSYARRCETLLDAVEQEVLLWNSTDAASQPEPYRPVPN